MSCNTQAALTSYVPGACCVSLKHSMLQVYIEYTLCFQSGQIHSCEQEIGLYQENIRQHDSLTMNLTRTIDMLMCVCVCVRERQRQREN